MHLVLQNTRTVRTVSVTCALFTGRMQQHFYHDLTRKDCNHEEHEVAYLLRCDDRTYKVTVWSDIAK